jgi:hypothetical protein
VFQAMLTNATRLCEAKFGNLYLYKGGSVHVAASHNVPLAVVAGSGPRGWGYCTSWCLPQRQSLFL